MPFSLIMMEKIKNIAASSADFDPRKTALIKSGSEGWAVRRILVWEAGVGIIWVELGLPKAFIHASVKFFLHIPIIKVYLFANYLKGF